MILNNSGIVSHGVENLEAAVRFHAMLANVQPSKFFFPADSQAYGHVDQLEHSPHAENDEHYRCSTANELYPQLRRIAAVNKAVMLQLTGSTGCSTGGRVVGCRRW